MEITSKILIAFVALMIGAVLIQTVASEALDKTQKVDIRAETINVAAAKTKAGSPDINSSSTASNFTIANNPTSWKQADCRITGFSYGNSTRLFTSGTDYIFYDTTGVIQLLNTSVVVNATIVSNNTFANYTHCPDDYLNQGWARTTTNLVPGFFGLAMLGIGLWMFFGIGRDLDFY